MNITNERVKLNTAPIKFWFGQCMKYDIYHTINWCVFNERQHIWYPVGNIGSKNNYHILSHLINTLFFVVSFLLFLPVACGDLLHSANAKFYQIFYQDENQAVRLWHSITIRFYITSHCYDTNAKNLVNSDERRKGS